MKYRYAVERGCTCCLMCYYSCPVGAIKIIPDSSATIDEDKCIGCGRCAGDCPAEAIVREELED